MLLLLARHGNTFGAGDKVVWVGARTDLPLAAEGRQQAEALGEALKPISQQIGRVVSGPLMRTCEHAAIACRVLAFQGSVGVEERLREIDYGLWEGKSSDEIRAAFGDAELRAWNERGAWPQSPGWSPPERAITENVAQIADELGAGSGNGDASLLITSNGILKFFLKLIPGAFEDMAKRGELKVATGNCCALRRYEAGWQVLFWDLAPSKFPF